MSRFMDDSRVGFGCESCVSSRESCALGNDRTAQILFLLLFSSLKTQDARPYERVCRHALEKANAARNRDRFRSIRGAKFFEQTRDVLLDRALGDEKFRGYRAVRASGGDEAKHLLFAPAREVRCRSVARVLAFVWENSRVDGVGKQRIRSSGGNLLEQRQDTFAEFDHEPNRVAGVCHGNHSLMAGEPALLQRGDIAQEPQVVHGAVIPSVDGSIQQGGDQRQGFLDASLGNVQCQRRQHFAASPILKEAIV